MSIKSLLRSELGTFHYYTPARLCHVRHLSRFLKRPINVWSRERIVYSTNGHSKGLVIDVEFIEHYWIDGCAIGHFALKNGKEPCLSEKKKYPNNCLFDAVAVQTGYDSNELRREVVRRERRMPTRNGRDSKEAADVCGGARYRGKSKRDAKRLLDEAQNGKSHPDGRQGHPRGHASDPKASGDYESVENYSKLTKKMKTGFLSRSDQEALAHRFLLTTEALEAMETLNEKGSRAHSEKAEVSADKFDERELPKAQEWMNGEKLGKPKTIRKAVAILRHFYGKHDDEDADVFVATFYPVI